MNTWIKFTFKLHLIQQFNFFSGHHKCRERWPDESGDFERAYNIFLDVFLLVLPVLLQGATYSLITRTLWQGMRAERALKNQIASSSSTSQSSKWLFYLLFPFVLK